MIKILQEWHPIVKLELLDTETDGLLAASEVTRQVSAASTVRKARFLRDHYLAAKQSLASHLGGSLQDALEYFQHRGHQVFHRKLAQIVAYDKWYIDVGKTASRVQSFEEMLSAWDVRVDKKDVYQAKLASLKKRNCLFSTYHEPVVEHSQYLT